MTTDNELVKLSLEGDERAFGQLYNKYWNSMVSFIKRMVVDEQIAEDIVQDTFIRIYKNLDKFNPKKSTFSTWSHTIATNLAKNEIKRQNNQNYILRKWVEEHYELSRSKTPEEELDKKLKYSYIFSVLDKLTENQRKAFIHKDIYGLSIEETAKKLGISISATKNRLHRARKAFKSLLQEDDNGAFF